jgi:hypothetical protein
MNCHAVFDDVPPIENRYPPIRFRGYAVPLAACSST